MAEQYYADEDILHGVSSAVSILIQKGEPLPMDKFSTEQIAALRSQKSIKTLDELTAATPNVAAQLASAQAEVERLRSLLEEANTPKSSSKKSASASDDDAAKVM